jgi:flagellar basal body-associated protein FliL
MAERQDEESLEKQPKKKIPLIYVAMGAQVLCLVGAIGFLINATLKIDKPRMTQQKMIERAVAAVRDDMSQIQMIPLEEFTVNLGGTSGVIQAKINVEVSNHETASLLSQRMPIVRARIIDLLSRQKPKNLSRIQGKLQLKDAVREALNETLIDATSSANSSGIVRDVFFVDLILM